MKRLTLISIVLMMAIVGRGQETQTLTPHMQREWRQMMQQREAPQPMVKRATLPAAVTKGETKDGRVMPQDPFWFPGEWEEVQAILVTPSYYYVPEGRRNGNWMADPVVTGYADYYRYNSYSGWQYAGEGGAYVGIVDTVSNEGQIFFSLMDAIQKGGAQAWVRVEQLADSAVVLRHLQRKGLRHSNLRFIAAPGNAFWLRDCGPICFYHGEGDTLAMLDFEYYTSRTLDDSLPVYLERQMGLPRYSTSIEWQGGNCLVDGTGMLVTSTSTYSRNLDTQGPYVWDGVNPNTINFSHKEALSESQVDDSLRALLATRELHVLPSYKYAGGTGHVDLYADMIDENQFVFSLMPDYYSTWDDYAIGARNRDSLCSYTSYFGQPYTAAYIPFPKDDDGDRFAGQVQYDQYYTRSYSNHTFVNRLIIQPCFSPVGSDGLPTAQWDREKIAQVQQAYPGYEIYCVDVSSLDGNGGAIHCVTKQIPVERPLRILHPALRGSTGNAYAGADVPVHAEVTCADGVEEVWVVYRVDGGQWQQARLTGSGHNYDGAMATAGVSYDGYATVDYYLRAATSAGKSLTKPMTAERGGYYTFYLGNGPEPEPLALAIADSLTGIGQFFPNPATGSSTLCIDAPAPATYELLLIDALGRMVRRESLQVSGATQYAISTTALAPGAYTVVLTSGDRHAVRRLMVID